jgi:hypothetical protein
MRAVGCVVSVIVLLTSGGAMHPKSVLSCSNAHLTDMHAKFTRVSQRYLQSFLAVVSAGEMHA